MGGGGEGFDYCDAIAGADDLVGLLLLLLLHIHNIFTLQPVTAATTSAYA